jgi:tetratricopeptide (TPR) repeat protein
LGFTWFSILLLLSFTIYSLYEQVMYIKASSLVTYKYLIITFLVICAYFPTFSGDFLLDDTFLVKNNPYIMSPQSLSSYFSQEDGIVDEKDAGVYHTGFYRPLINITYFLDYKIWGMNAYGFRITNLFLHLLTCIVIFKLFKHFSDEQRTAFWCTLLFSLHPVNTESVSFIVARNNILVTLFSISSLYSYITAIEKKQIVRLIIAIISFACGLFSKEFGIMILPIFFLYNRFLASRKNSISSECLSYLPFIIIAFLYLYLRHMVTGDMVTPFFYSLWLRRIYFVPYILAWDLRILLLPYGLHQFNISYPASYLDPYAMLSILLVLLLGLMLWTRRNNRLIIFSCISFLLVMFPILSIIPSAATSKTLVSLRWLYLPMIFILLVFEKIIRKYMVNKGKLLQIILTVCICYFGVYTYFMNRFFWYDEKTFFSQEVFLFNNMSHAGGVAEYFFKEGKLTEAEKYYKIAIDYSPDSAHNYINYAALLITKKKYDDAVSILNRAKDMLMIHHEQGQWHNNMGMALWEKGDVEGAISHFNMAVKSAPEEAIFWGNLGGAYGNIGNYAESVKAFKKGLEASPDSIELKIKLATSYYHLKNYEKAVLTLEEIPEDERKTNKDILILLKNINKAIKTLTWFQLLDYIPNNC